MVIYLFKSLLTVEIIALFSLLLSLVNAAYLFSKHRRNLSISVGSYWQAGKTLYLDMEFLNRSSNPIAVSGIQIHYEKMIMCDKKPRVFLNSRQTHQPNNVTQIHTASFPIKLDGFASDSAIVIFSDPCFTNKSIAGQYDFFLFTTRGSVKITAFVPPKDLKGVVLSTL